MQKNIFIKIKLFSFLKLKESLFLKRTLMGLGVIMLLLMIFPLSGYADSSRMQKWSICYSGHLDDTGYGTYGTRQYLAEHFDLIDTNFASSYNTIIQWIKSHAGSYGGNPNIKAIGYYDAIFEPSASLSENSYLHSLSGNRIVRSGTYAGQYLMNPNLGWKPYFINRCTTSLSTYTAFDGIFADDCVSDYLYDYSLVPKERSEWNDGFNYTTTGYNTWSNWMVTFVTATKAALGSKMLMTNSFSDLELAQAAGAMTWENFLHSKAYSYTEKWYSPDSTISTINTLHNLMVSGVKVAVESGISDGTAAQKEEFAKFCYAAFSFSAVDLGNAYFAWGFMGSSPTTNPTWYSFMDTNLGIPIGNYYQVKDYVYARNFNNYYVIANLNNVGTYTSFAFNGTNYNLEGKHALLIQKTNPPQNQPPVLAPIGNKTVNEGSLLQFTITATDPDGNPLTYKDRFLLR